MNKMLRWGLVLGGSLLLAGGSTLGVRQWAYSSSADMVKNQTGDKDKVLGRLKLAYGLGNKKAASLMGQIYQNGLLVPQDQAEALLWYRKAADSGDPDGQNYLGMCLRDGLGAAKDPVEAEKLFRRAADQGNASAKKNLGIMLMMATSGIPTNPQEGIRFVRQAADAGDAAAECMLGVMYSMGNGPVGIQKDPTEAMKWIRKSAEQGFPQAQELVGEAYQHGFGVSADFVEARKWYEKAAAQGLPEALTNLGVLYDDGKGVEKDPAEAIKFYQRAADQGSARAQALLGSKLMDDGKFDEAARWFQAAVDNGNEAAREMLAMARKYATQQQNPIEVQRLGLVLDEYGRPRVRGLVQNNGSRMVDAMVYFDLVRPDGVVVEQFNPRVSGLMPGGRQLIDIAVAPYHANTRVAFRGVECR